MMGDDETADRTKRTIVCGSYSMELVDKGDGQYEVRYSDLGTERSADPDVPPSQDCHELYVKQEPSPDGDVGLPDGESVGFDFRDHCYYTKIGGKKKRGVNQKDYKYDDYHDEEGPIPMETDQEVENMSCCPNTPPSMSTGKLGGDTSRHQHDVSDIRLDVDLGPKPGVDHDPCVALAVEIPEESKNKNSALTRQTRLQKDIEDPNKSILAHKCKHIQCTRWFTSKRAVIRHEQVHKRTRQGCKCYGCKRAGRPRRIFEKKIPYKSTVKPYKFSCSVCLKVYLINTSTQDQYLEEYLRDGIKIRCSACSAIAMSSGFAPLNDEQQNDLISPLFLCSHPSCGVTLYRSVMSLKVHRLAKHPESRDVSKKRNARSGTSKSPNIAMDKKPNQIKLDLCSGLKCDSSGCVKVFQTDAALQRHRQRHKEGGQGCSCHGCRARAALFSYYALRCSSCQSVHRIRIRKTNPLINTGMDIICLACNNRTLSSKVFREKRKTKLDTSAKIRFLCPEPGCKMQPFSVIARMLQHMMYHSKNEVHCKHCSQKLRNKTALSVHYSHCPALNNPATCFLCMTVLRNEHALSGHMRRRHRHRDQFLCEDCGQSFANATTWKHHREKHLREKSGVVREAPEKKYLCASCNKGFAQPRLLQQHISRIHKEKDRVCDVCGMKFKTNLQLSRHRTIHDPSTRTAVCSVCKARFRENNALNEHMEREHLGKRDECKMCSKKFKSRHGYRLHMRRHETEHLPGKMYRCLHCDKNYASLLGFKLHMKNIHSLQTPHAANVE